MRLLLALFSGFFFTLCAFGGGIVFALAFLSAKPVTVENLAAQRELQFPAEPVRIDTARQDFARIDPVPTREEPAATTQADELLEVASIDAAAPQMADEDPLQWSPEHVAWCRERYRSYDPQTNLYRPLSGGTRECVSPFTPGQDAIAPEPEYVGDSGEGLSAAHIASCFARYRSYRVEDNSYQPYGGGPRRQCR